MSPGLEEKIILFLTQCTGIWPEGGSAGWASSVAEDLLKEIEDEKAT